jgi:copper(I)-binding protein
MAVTKKGVIIVFLSCADRPKLEESALLNDRLRRMKFTRIMTMLCSFAAAMLVASAPAAQTVKAANAWARATAPLQKTASVYLDLTSDRNAALVAAGSPFARRAELHSMSVEGGIMRMRPLPAVDLPAGQTVRLAPNGQHIMLFDLKRELRPGDRLPLVLSIQSSGTSLTSLSVDVEVRGLAPDGPHKH